MELVLNSYGLSLSRDNEGFVLGNSDVQKRIPVDGVDSIRVSQGARISSDAILLALENEVEVLFMDKGGNVKGRVWSPKYGSISTIRKGQLTFVSSSSAVAWIKDVLLSKIDNQQALITMLKGEEQDREYVARLSVSRLEYCKMKIKDVNGERISDVASSLRGIEGAASRAFFNAYSSMLPESARFECRSQHPATDPANALLNYGYGILYGKVESALISAGIDPYIGILHRDEYNRPVMVYDVIEKYRVWAEYVVFRILEKGVVTDEFYSRKDDGSVWLESLGRRVLIQSMNDYLEEVITSGKLTRSRATMIDIYAQSLAQKFKNNN